MPTPRIALALALLPAFILAPACDDKEVPGPDTGEAADTDGTGETTDGEDTPAATTGATDGEDTDARDTEASSSTGTDPTDPVDPPPPAKPEPAVQCPGELAMECTAEGGEMGQSICLVVDGEQVWTACVPALECYPGDSWDQGCTGQICAFDGEQLYLYSWSEPDCNTPLVLNFDGAPLRFDAAAAAAFDISGVGECLSTDWPALPWLALDRDGDGAIESGRELFGSGTRLRGGARASDGFEALRELDANRDGRIDTADPAFAELVLWSDGDGDRRGELAELLPVTAVDLVAIHLDVAVRIECDDRGNCGRERSRFEFRAPTGEVRSGEVVDVYLACQ